MPEIGTERLKAGIFNSPGIRQIINNPHKFNSFIDSMSKGEGNTWMPFFLVISNYLYNQKAQNNAELVNNILINFIDLCCNISVKVH